MSLPNHLVGNSYCDITWSDNNGINDGNCGISTNNCGDEIISDITCDISEFVMLDTLNTPLPRNKSILN